MNYVKKSRREDYDTFEAIKRYQELKVKLKTEHHIKEYLVNKEGKKKMITELNEEKIDEEVKRAIEYYMEKAIEFSSQ